MIASRKAERLKPLPVVLKPRRDELLSSWLRRHAGYYGVTERALIVWLRLGTSFLRALDHRLDLGQVARTATMLRSDPVQVVDMTHTARPAQARGLVRQGRGGAICYPCADRHQAQGAVGAVLKSWTEAWRVTCRRCGAPLTAEVGSRPGEVSRAPTLREASDLGDRWWREAVTGQDILEQHLAGQVTPLGSPVALMRLLLLPSWYRPGKPVGGFYSGWLLNEIVCGFDVAAHPTNTGSTRVPLAACHLSSGWRCSLVSLRSRLIRRL